MFLSQITTKQKKALAAILAVLILAGGGIWSWHKLVPFSGSLAELSQEDMAMTVKPSVVRIIQHVSGKITMPGFRLDLARFDISVNPDSLPQTFKVDKYYSGSGVVVNPDGYILTNAHVVAKETAEQEYAETVLKTLLGQAAGLNGSEAADLGRNNQSLRDFTDKVLAFIKTNSDFSLKTEVTVLNPASTQISIDGLLQNGFPAEVMDYDHDFLSNEIDLALIKINRSNLPAIKLGDDAEAAVGNRIFVFGFPSTAELNEKNPLQASFTGGLVSAIKFSQTKDFKIFQTDAKISEGSSGGPVLNDRGEVIGFITFETGQDGRLAGDNFAFALPAGLAKKILDDNSVKNIEGNFPSYFSRGLKYYYAKQCQKARQEFIAARQTDPEFAVNKYLNAYAQKCDQLIAQGESLDSDWQQFIFRIKSLSGLTWFVVGGRIILLLLLTVLVLLAFNRMRKDEKEVDELSAQIRQDEQEKAELLRQLAKKGVQLPQPETEMHQISRQKLDIPHPHIIDFIIAAREAGLKDGHIAEELERAGWSREEIVRALKYREETGGQ